MTKQESILFGTAFYEEYQPDDHLMDDIRLLKEAHMNVIRVGEGSWSHWEPEDGVFSLDWLQPVLDAAQENDISVIIGMPTFAVPQWLVRKYPEIAMRDQHGAKRFFGGREEHSLNHPAFRWYAERVCRKIVERYAQHPSVIGWQLHNEPGLWINYAPDVFEGFKDWLRHRYGTVSHLNKEWGLVYWSHELSTWDDFWKPEGNTQPQYDIEWRRYQAEITDDVLAWQKNVIQELGRSEQIITVNYALGREAIDEVQSAKHLDVAGVDPYYLMQDGFAMPQQISPKSAWPTVGPWSIASTADRSYSLKQQPFWVMETNAGAIDGSFANYPGYNGQWRQAAWQMIARGAEMIEYWHWQQLHYGTETYWGGVLPHDRCPGRIYKQLAALGEEFARFGSTVIGLTPEYDITILYSVESRWGLTFQPYSVSKRGNLRNSAAYDALFASFYEGAFVSGRQVRLVNDEQLVDWNNRILESPRDFAQQHPVLVVPGYYVSSDSLLRWMNEYARYGGHLILGPRTAYTDNLARPFLNRKPAYLDKAAGVMYQEFSNLDQSLSVRATGGMHLRDKSAATTWLDCLIPETATSLVVNDHPHFGTFPVVVENCYGDGSIVTVGTVPNEQLVASVYDYVLGGADQWIFGHSSVSRSSAKNREGEILHFLFNWSWTADMVKLPVPCRRLGHDDIIESVDLDAWDVAILREEIEVQHRR